MTRFLYLHGFAASPTSRKAAAFRQHFARQSIDVECVDLRVPSLELLRVSSMIDAALARIEGPTFIIGSSLGGMTAAHVAASDSRVRALVLLAPAFGVSERWSRRLGDDVMRTWQESGWLSMPNDPDGPPRLHYEFLKDADDVEKSGPFPDVQVPTLVIHGTRDEVVPIEISRSWVQGKPHMQMVELDDDHAMYASLDRLCSEADAFFAGVLS